jgi:heme-degrading monooxygenase HmoA
MTTERLVDKSQRVYRVDRFAVPKAGREEFLSRVRDTHELLRTQPGFLRDFVLEQSLGPGQCNFVTIVEWDNEESVANARAAVMARRQETGFDPQELFARLGIIADLANYRQVDDRSGGGNSEN